MGVLKKFDWNAVQQDYDSGLSWRGLQRKYGMAVATIIKATHRGDLKSRTKSEANRLYIKTNGVHMHSEQTKRKISKIRRKYLEENPDKVPYLMNHSSKESYPERIFRTALESANLLGWVQEYRSGIYRYDFAFPELKLDIEIDGGTHKDASVKKIDSRRDKWSRKNGWKVIRFTAKRVKEDVIGCINEVKELLT